MDMIAVTKNEDVVIHFIVEKLADHVQKPAKVFGMLACGETLMRTP